MAIKVTLASGVWLSRLGRPFSGFILTIHKRMGLGAGVYRLAQVMQAGLCFLAAGAVIFRFIA